ncbi:hypothetical protein VitviT2T_014095 [Vitis vinifera]|uniref:Pirin N-terminal domain-containing protein n=1 Tax=Vitis vinifera TaxID=29760 RepID=A0ABY9CL47_VITVI|nr:hypothetical protein VitviT2T_014095 [Vitis vinifera]
MLDKFAVAPLAGFPDHPHRSFETVTYMLQGAFTHQDFVEHKGTIRTGNVQWMTKKMIEPNYHELPSEDIKGAEKDGVKV